jgi:hypothetical protein
LDAIRLRTNSFANGDIERPFVCRKCSKRFRWREVEALPAGEAFIEWQQNPCGGISDQVVAQRGIKKT